MTETIEKKAGRIAEVGKPEPVDIATLTQRQPAPAKKENPEGDGGTGQPDNPEGQGDDKKVNLSDDELKSLYEQRFKKESKAPEPTPEELAAKEKELEKRMHDLYVAQGGKGADFYNILQASKSDLTKLTEEQLHWEYKNAGFTDDQINILKTERYYQLNPDEVEQGEDESDEDYAARKEFIKKKVEFGTKRLEAKGKQLQSNAQGILDTLRDTISQQELQVQEEVNFTAKVEEAAKELPRKITAQLGMLDNQPLDPVDIEVSEAEISEVISTLKDPVQRNQILFNQDGSLNITSVANLLLRNKILEKSVREGLFAGQTRQVAHFKKVFPDKDPHSLGVGSTPASNKSEGKKGKVGSYGKAQVMNQPANRKR